MRNWDLTTKLCEYFNVSSGGETLVNEILGYLDSNLHNEIVIYIANIYDIEESED